MKQFTAGENDAGVRLSRFVLGVTCGLPDALMYKSFRNRRVKVNGKRAAPDYRIRFGDVIELYLNDEFFPEGAPTVRRLTPDKPLPPLDILHRESGIAVLYKPAGVLAHRDAGGEATLLDAFTARMTAEGGYNPESENAFAPALCNRLDRGTEGLVLAAYTAPALRGVNEIIRLGLLAKTYLCVCVGRPPEGEHHAFLARDRTARTVSVTEAPIPGAKPIHTGVAVLETAGPLCLCEVTLHTGRTHQIRAHLAHLGAPLLGDRKYGPASLPPGLPAPDTQALCAWKLCFAPELPDSGLARFAGQCFTATQARLPRLWEAWQKQETTTP